MPTFTALALDRLIEPRDSKSVDMPVPNSKPPLKLKSGPNPNSKLQRRNSASVVKDRKTERKVNCPKITPALYATPETTPLPDSPSSFPPSPYIINHKRRGPRLLKSFSQADVASCKQEMDEGEVDGDAEKIIETKSLESTRSASGTFIIPDPIREECASDVSITPIAKECMNGLHVGSSGKEHLIGVSNGEFGSCNEESDGSSMVFGSASVSNGLTRKKDAPKLVALSLERDSEYDDFFDPQDSMSHTSNTDGEDNIGPESSAKAATPMAGEFYDAWEELSSESGPQSSHYDVEAELREIRLSLLMEIEKRKQTEESLNDMRTQWQRIREQLAHVGLTLPADPTAVAEGEQPNIDPAEELCRQVYLARFVSESVGRGVAKAETEVEMEAQIEAKNFEIARLCDRLHYYEAMNREMSQRNQEAVEMTRRDRQRRKRRQRWIWGSIAAAITLGTAALAWSYLPTGKASTSNGGPQAPEHDDATKK